MQKYIIVTDAISHLRGWVFDNVKHISFKDYVRNPVKADLAYFSGGADVSPYLYDEPVLPHTYSHPKRDILELEVYNEIQNQKVPCLGICRGSQFLTAVQPKGRIIQDVFGHNLGHHEIKLVNSGESMLVSSTHHQMMYPFDVNNFELLAVSSPARSHNYIFGKSKGDEQEVLNKYGEPEIVYYPNTKSLAIQGHPEDFINKEDPFPIYCKKLILEKLLNNGS